MKGSHNNITGNSYMTTKRKEGFYRYLMPGTLAQLRDSKITAKWHQKHDLETHMISSFQLALHGVTLSSPNQNNNTPYPRDAVPCFASRINYHPRCLQRKKLIAVTPVFHETDLV
ncbi:hypothetical protein ACB098_05G173700 [Castanea mollissima]